MHDAAAAIPEPASSTLHRVWTGMLLGLGVTPRFSFTLKPTQVTLGQSFAASFQVWPRTLRASCLELWLEGRERAIYRRGTEVVSDECLFFRQLVLRKEGRAFSLSGKAMVTVPEGAMPTLNLPHNQIEWRLVLKVRTLAQTNVEESLLLAVQPVGARLTA